MDTPETLGRILITGASGFIGSHLAENLLARKADVVCLRHNASLPDDLPAITADLRNGDAIRRATEGVSTVFHLGGIAVAGSAHTEPDQAFQINTAGTQQILEAARLEGARVILLSTAHVFGPPVYLPVTEEHPTAPASIYAATKLAADVMALAYHRCFGVPVTIVRPFNVYGPRQGTVAVIPTIITQAIRGGPVRLRDLRPRRDFLYVDDVVDGLVRAASTPAAIGQTILLASGQAVSIAGLVRRIVSLISESASDTSAEEQDDSDSTYGESTRARELLGWTPRIDLDQGLSRTIEWWRRQRTI